MRTQAWIDLKKIDCMLLFKNCLAKENSTRIQYDIYKMSITVIQRRVTGSFNTARICYYFKSSI